MPATNNQDVERIWEMLPKVPDNIPSRSRSEVTQALVLRSIFPERSENSLLYRHKIRLEEMYSKRTAFLTRPATHSAACLVALSSSGFGTMPISVTSRFVIASWRHLHKWVRRAAPWWHCMLSGCRTLKGEKVRRNYNG